MPPMQDTWFMRLVYRLSPPRLRKRLRTILILSWISLAFIVVSGVALAVHISDTESWQAHQQETARNAAIIVDSYLSRVLNTLSLLDSFGSDEFIESSDAFESILEQQPSIQEIIYLDADANVLASLARTNSLLSDQFTIAQSEWFLKARGGETYFSRAQISAQDESFMIVSIPSRFGGVLAVRVELQILWDVVRDIRFEELGKIYVLNQDGRVMAHTDRDIVLQNRLMPDAVKFREIISAPKHEWSGRLKNFSGNHVVAAAAPIDTTGWIVIAELPVIAAYSTTMTVLWVIPLLMLLFSFVSIRLIEQFVERLFLIPILNLRTGASEVGQGNLSYQAPVLQDDELGEFTEAFNGMTHRLNDQHHSLERELQIRHQIELQLRELNEDLENRVAGRTAELEDSLREKEVLLKEVHHRVKNNLQVISSLLSLQARKSPDGAVRSMLMDSQSRVHSMSLIHEKLYHSESLEFVDFGVYIHTLASYLFQTYNTRAGIRFNVQADPVLLSLNQAVPCGLFVNEVITNALKYAFIDRDEGLIVAEIRSLPDDFIQFRIADNGNGMDKQQQEQTNSLGMQLIQSLAVQLDGEMAVCISPGVEYILTFKGEYQTHG